MKKAKVKEAKTRSKYTPSNFLLDFYKAFPYKAGKEFLYGSDILYWLPSIFSFN